MTAAPGMLSVCEPIDLALYQAIRAEGLARSQAMRYAGELADGIGARLMGSPNLLKANEWSLATFAALGLTQVHLEDIGEFGISWRQNNSWMRMVAPDSMVFVAQAAPWSIASHGPQQGFAVAVELANDADFDRYRGRLAGKIVFLGPLRALSPPFEPFALRFTEQQLESEIALGPVRQYYAGRKQRLTAMSLRNLFNARRLEFLKREKVLAVVVPSADGESGGGTGNLTIDEGIMAGLRPWRSEERPGFPIMVTAIEHFGRVWRLLAKNTAVQLQFEVDSEVLNEHEHGYNVVAEIPGSDPAFKGEYVLLGAHLDSWAAGTGAADNGAGVAISMEAMRILQALQIKPRRSIRIVLYSGEEVGLLGSSAYVGRHLGAVPRSGAPDQLAIPAAGWRTRSAALQRGPEHALLSAAYHLDSGSGRVRGVTTGGNPALAAVFRAWVAPLRDLGVSAVFDTAYWPADQSSFTEVGLPGVLFVQDPLDCGSRAHHSNMDTVERLVPEDMAQAAVVTAIFVLNTANRTQLLPRGASAVFP